MPQNQKQGPSPSVPVNAGLPAAFNRERFAYEVASEIGIDLNRARNNPSVQPFESSTHAASQGGRGAAGRAAAGRSPYPTVPSPNE